MRGALAPLYIIGGIAGFGVGLGLKRLIESNDSTIYIFAGLGCVVAPLIGYYTYDYYRAHCRICSHSAFISEMHECVARPREYCCSNCIQDWIFCQRSEQQGTARLSKCFNGCGMDLINAVSISKGVNTISI